MTERTGEAIRPQPGPQEDFLACRADIAIYGGAAFGGKTFALLLEAARFVAEPSYGAVIFRRTSPQIVSQGGLWDTAEEIYPRLGAVGVKGRLQWRFPSGARITFSHLQHEKDKYSWQGAQLPLIGLDEATQFTEGQFFYLLSRNRDPSGTIRPYVRVTCNPDPDSFVADLVSWWIDHDTGLAIPERSGVVRWFIRHHDSLVWADARADLERDYPGCEPMSFTFIPSSYKDNALGLAADPGYLSRLASLPRVEAERLRQGNWLIRPAAGDYFRASDLPVCAASEIPPRRIRIRWWDRAASLPSDSYPDPDWTVGALLSLDQATGWVTVEHIDRFRGRPGTVSERIRARAEEDGRETTVGLFRDPGQAGIAEAESYVRLLAGYSTVVLPETASKETRAAPLASYAQGAGAGHGLVRLVHGPWNSAFIAEAESFPRGGHDDQVDAAAGAFAWLAARLVRGVYDYRPVRPTQPESSLRILDAPPVRMSQAKTDRLGLRRRAGGLW